MKNAKFKLIIFRILVTTTFIVITLFVLGIFYYPGGSTIDENHIGFDFKYNSISDLGRIIALNGEPNLISRILFSIALTLTAFVIITFYLVAWSFFQENKVTKVLSIIGSIFGATQAILYFGIIATPLDVYLVVHNGVLYTVEAFLIGAIVLYIVVYFLSKKFPRVNAYAFLFLLISAVIYAIVILFAYLFQESLVMICSRMGHTLYIVATIIAYGLQPIGGIIYLKRKDDFSIYYA